ncbi:DUF4249 family protein [Flavobacterium sp.]|uniref:DUF4249 family protein n=1 Tax=Flavobacterium sp. TaxID=239 RepID=UPI003D0C3C8A
MKLFFKYLYLLGLLTMTFGCEEVVDIPLENTNPKLVIDANLTWQKGTTGAQQTIKLSITNDFYTNEIKIASGAIVTVTDNDNTLFTFNQKPNTPDYVCTNFTPAINKEYTLKVVYEGQTYTSSSKLLSSPAFEPEVKQSLVPGFGAKEIIKLQLFFKDNALEENYYLLSAKNPKLFIQEFLSLEDRFTQGNIMEAAYFNEKTQKDDNFKFSLQAVNKTHFNYIKKLLSISGQNSGGPFSTPPATLRGNIINQTDSENYPFGFFSVSEIDYKEYTVK